MKKSTKFWIGLFIVFNLLIGIFNLQLGIPNELINVYYLVIFLFYLALCITDLVDNLDLNPLFSNFHKYNIFHKIYLIILKINKFIDNE